MSENEPKINFETQEERLARDLLKMINKDHSDGTAKGLDVFGRTKSQRESKYLHRVQSKGKRV